jgi:hypothetical protein
MAARALPPYAESMLLELAIVVLSVAGFIALDYYVSGCERV